MGIDVMTTHETQLLNEEGNPLLTDFGVFYPTGYIVAAFEREEDAQQVRQDLMTGGYHPCECQIASAEFVAETAQHNIDSTGFLARLGASIKFVESHLEAARRGATFLLIYAPIQLDAERAMRVVRRVPFILAHRYTRLVIEDLK
jgi:hypothetical protein